MIRQWASLTGCTDRRRFLTSIIADNRGSCLICTKVTGRSTTEIALISTHSQRRSSLVLLGCARAITSITPTITFNFVNVRKNPISQCHVPHKIARLIIAHSVPFFTLFAARDLVVPPPNVGSDLSSEYSIRAMFFYVGWPASTPL